MALHNSLIKISNDCGDIFSINRISKKEINKKTTPPNINARI